MCTTTSPAVVAVLIDDSSIIATFIDYEWMKPIPSPFLFMRVINALSYEYHHNQKKNKGSIYSALQHCCVPNHRIQWWWSNWFNSASWFISSSSSLLLWFIHTIDRIIKMNNSTMHHHGSGGDAMMMMTYQQVLFEIFSWWHHTTVELVVEWCIYQYILIQYTQQLRSIYVGLSITWSQWVVRTNEYILCLYLAQLPAGIKYM